MRVNNVEVVLNSPWNIFSTDLKDRQDVKQKIDLLNNEEFSYVIDPQFEIYVREVIIGLNSSNSEKMLSHPEECFVKYVALDLDYESCIIFEQLFAKIRERQNKIGTRNPKSVSYFYLLPITPKTSSDLLWFLARFRCNIPDSLHNKLKDQEKKYLDNKNLVANISKGESIKKIEVDYAPFKLRPEIVPTEKQMIFYSLLAANRKLGNYDYMGGGKTLQALLVATLPDSLPVIIPVPNQIKYQWLERIEKKYFEGAIAQIIEGSHTKININAHFYICSYEMLGKTYNKLCSMGLTPKTVIGDEVEAIRNLDTEKSKSFGLISEACNYSIGLSGTPLGKNGLSFWSTLHRTNENNSLGPVNLFRETWCNQGYNIEHPAALREFILKNGDAVSRTRKELGLDSMPKIEREILVDPDVSHEKEEKDRLIFLAKSLLSLDVKTDKVVGEMSFAIRKETAKSKAKSVAQLAKMYLEMGRKVVVTGWFREYWDILSRELRNYNPIMITGTESPKLKDINKNKFINNEAYNLLFVSVESTAGLDGLQQVCYTLIHGDFPWLVKTVHQINSRLLRPGQEETVEILYPYVNSGSDPLMKMIHGVQASQLNGLLGEKIVGEDDSNESNSQDQSTGNINVDKEIKALQESAMIQIAKNILEKYGVSYEKEVVYSEFHTSVSNLLKSLTISTSDEINMQEHLFNLLERKFPNYRIQREVVISKRSRLDFLITSPSGERIVIECKTNSRGKESVYKQVERYILELSHESTILFCPWEGVNNGYINNHPVEIINYNKREK